MPRSSDHLLKSAIRLVRQFTTVQNTSNTRAFTAEISDMLGSSLLLFRTNSYFVIPRCAIAHRGCARLAQARNPYSRLWLWIPGSRQRAPRNDDGENIFPCALNRDGISRSGGAPP